MIDALPSVVLLFDDAELGNHLRQALQERGARIVHEGTVAGFDAALLRQFDPDALVVNLDKEDDESLERLFGMLKGERARLVFNDARASRALAGWDRARWARHLAMKVLASGDVDPPRAVDALVVEAVPQPSETIAAFPPESADRMSPIPQPEALDTPVSAGHPGHVEEDAAAPALAALNDLEADLAASLAAPTTADPVDSEATMVAEPEAPETAEPVARHDQAEERGTHALQSSDDFEAEFAALLANDDLPVLHDDVSAPVATRQELPLHEGDFSFALHTGDADPAAPVATPAPVEAAKASAVPDSWVLVDYDAAVRPDASPAPTEDFGIHKRSAADVRAPAAPEFKPTMSLDLMPMEDAAAPQAWEHSSSNEMLLDDLGNALSRVVLLGAPADGLDSACGFLASLPVSARHVILLTQHFGMQPVEAVLQRLTNHSALPVRLATHGSRARHGEVLLVPANGQVQLSRNGSIELREHVGDGEPSIDASFSMAASAFGRDALGIVFAGHSTDAVAGAQAIHDRGGQVWVESTYGEHHADMVSGIFAERLVSYSGTPHELAAHLIEVYP